MLPREWKLMHDTVLPNAANMRRTVQNQVFTIEMGECMLLQ